MYVIDKRAFTFKSNKMLWLQMCVCIYKKTSQFFKRFKVEKQKQKYYNLEIEKREKEQKSFTLKSFD